MTTATALQSERQELLDLLLERGILRRTEAQPVLSRDGTSARWMLDSLAVTLTPRGAELAGRLILECLRRFDGRQVATYGLTAVPILQSAVLQSGGRYRGLLVRKERKAHGSQKLIEGVVDQDEPVILIDDSIASGMSVTEGIATLEAAGLRVEGCVALVRFGWEGGCSRLRERGYRVETVYDIFEDLMARMEGEQGPDYNPTKNFPEFRWSERRASEGRHPAHLAREILNEYLTSGELLRPPDGLDRGDYDSKGGAFVSLRSRDDIFDRHARDGFWHFPQERSWGPAEDVVRATLLTARALPAGAEGLKLLESSHIAVTLFGALEQATVGELDNDRYGIVVVSAERPEIMGGALPRMPGIRDEWQQFRHARYNNAALYPYEPYTIYRHEVCKFVEPGAEWQPSGAPGRDESPDFGMLAERAREIVMGRAIVEPLSDVALPPSAKQLFVTVYIDGYVRGCMGSEIGDLNEDLRELTEAALADDRFEPSPIEEDSSVAVSVSVLSSELEMGDFSREEVRFRYRHGRQALMLDKNGREGMLLPCVATWMSLDAEDFVDEVIDKAGVTRPPYNWRRFDCDVWLADADGTWKLDGAFKQTGAAPLPLRAMARLHAEYLLRNQRPDGSLYFSYHPFQNTLYQGIDMARLAHGAWTLARAGLRDAAVKALECVLRNQPEAPLVLSRDAFVLLAHCEPGMPGADAPALASKLWESIDRHGRIITWLPPPAPEQDDDAETEESPEAVDPDDLQNYTPGQVLLALAAAASTGAFPADPRKLGRTFLYYRHRFRNKRDFGQVSWMALAWAAWWRLRGDAEFAGFVFEIADWILEFQQAHTGAFLTDHQPDAPGYTTAVYLEAIAAAANTASGIGDMARYRRYVDAHRRGFEFLDRLILQDRDSSVLPNPDYAAGGLRESLYSSHVRIDFVQHSLAAILELHPDALVNNQLGESEWQKNASPVQ
ncbi:MAG: AMMECR1 domain-containing protein [Acidobacteriota bacterium]|nr:AMMECR1 domain-containing protein [Acidobacteriota bacterium]